MPSAKRNLLFLGTGLVALAALSGCEAGNSTEIVWQDNGTPEFINSHQTWWNHKFVYHPYAEVYFEPYSHTYYWKDDAGDWWSANTLPPNINIDHATAQVVRLSSELPFEQHRWVENTTMPPNPQDPARGHASAPYSPGF